MYIKIPIIDFRIEGKFYMKKALMIVSVLIVAVISTACINNIAVQELNNKAAEYMQKGDYESAMNRLQASLDLDATMYETYYNLGIAAINAKRFDKAIEALEGGIKIKPDFADFYYSLGLAQCELADETVDEEKVELPDDKKLAEETKEQNKAKAIELKKSGIENLTKYIEMSPDAKDKETIEELIKESNDFINGDTPKEAEE